MSRTVNTIRNIFYGLSGKVIGLLANFLSRTVFIYYLGNIYLGINSLYAEVLSALSFAELGLGSALIYAMYEPVAKNRNEETVQLLRFYRNAYRVIAGVVGVIGVAIIPFLPRIVKGADFLTLHELRLYYSIFLCNTVFGYFVTYKYSYVNALQKNYISMNFDAVVSIVVTTLQILMIIFTRNYLAYLLTHTFCLLFSRVALSVYLNRRFPILVEKPRVPLDKEQCKKIFKNVRALAFGQFATVAIYSTDNMIISALSGLGVAAVGLVSNYMMLINGVLGFVTVLFNSMVSGFGNLVATSSRENYRKAFSEANFLNFWIYGFCSIAFFSLIPPFITLWIGRENLIGSASFFLITVNVYLQGQYVIYAQVRSASGNFSCDIAPVIIEPIVNLIVSIIGAKTLGLLGVYIGTTASRVVIIMRPLLGYRRFFGCSSLEYYRCFFSYFFATILAGGLTNIIVYKLLREVTLGKFALSICVVAVIPNLLFWLFFHRTEEFRGILRRMRILFLEKREER